ncbi:MAG: cupin domain-containing protein [Treponema sp.]|jgi:mannose-6-phosphate isomerase-like protein (cupin superfamily)|nr:cupin domain-containing protein [Treponema sp.]
MIIHRNEMRVEQKTNMRDGEGTVTLTHFLDESNEKNTRLLAEVTLPPGTSIGYHQHNRETEYFIIVSGIGAVNDNGTDAPIKAGDVIVTGNGASHSIRNTGTTPLVFHAVIITY